MLIHAGTKGLNHKQNFKRHLFFILINRILNKALFIESHILTSTETYLSGLKIKQNIAVADSYFYEILF